MLQRSSLSSTSTAEIADTLQRSLAPQTWEGARWRRLQDFLPLPTTWQQYLLACIGLAVVLGGMLLHVLLSVQIARSDFQLRQLRSDYARIERQNSELVYQIAQQSSLAQMATLAEAQGYVPTTGRTYVLRSGPLPADSLEGNALAAAARRPAADEPASAPAAWLEQTTHWWQGLSQSSATAAAQFWRDITGRVE